MLRSSWLKRLLCASLAMAFAKTLRGIGLRPSSLHGFGVFAELKIHRGEVIESCPCLWVTPLGALSSLFHSMFNHFFMTFQLGSDSKWHGKALDPSEFGCLGAQEAERVCAGHRGLGRLSLRSRTRLRRHRSCLTALGPRPFGAALPCLP